MDVTTSQREIAAIVFPVPAVKALLARRLKQVAAFMTKSNSRIFYTWIAAMNISRLLTLLSVM